MAAASTASIAAVGAIRDIRIAESQVESESDFEVDVLPSFWLSKEELFGSCNLDFEMD